MRIRILSLFAAGVLLASCGDDKSSTPSDTTPPATISDLACVDSVGDQIVLTWTSTGGDGDIGQAAAYDLRFAFEPITEGNWAQAIPIAATPAPQTSGEAEEATTNDITWWETTYFAIKARDSAGNWSALSNVEAAIPQPDANLRLIARTRDGAFLIDFITGAATLFAAQSGPIEVIEPELYFASGHTLSRYTTSGVPAGTVTLPDTASYLNFCALPDGRFALLDNNRDVIQFVAADGTWIGEVSMFDEPGSDLQNVDGVVVGNQLIVSETGTNHLLAIDLLTFAVSDFKDLTSLGGWLGGIDYYRGEFYLTQYNSVQRFTAAGAPELVATLDVSNVVGIAVAGGYSFVAVNFGSAIYRVNNRTGEFAPLASGLNYPQDVELLRL